MAQRRMFSNRIANSAKFLQMPAESQLLYFHMVQRADDDGVVEAYPLLRLLNLAPDNYKLLIAKGYITPLNEDQVIVVVDWLEHNNIRADRKVDSIYKNLLLTKVPTLNLVEPRPRTDVEDNSRRIGGQSTDGIGKVRLGKVKMTISQAQSSPSELVSSEAVQLNEDGEIIVRKKAGPKNTNLMTIAKKFSDMCRKQIAIVPITDGKALKAVSFALNTAKLNEKLILDLFDEWFTLGLPDEETVSISRALSARQIERYKIRNQIQ